MRFLRSGVALGIGLMASLLLATPASAKATTEFIVSGGNLPRPVFVSAEEVATVEGWVMGGEAGVRPERLGSKYDLDVLQFQVNAEAPPMRSVLGRWVYYPEAGGALTQEDEWIPFSPKLNGLVAARISDQQQAAGGEDDAPLMFLLIGAVCLGAGFFGGRLLRRRSHAGVTLGHSAALDSTAVA